MDVAMRGAALEWSRARALLLAVVAWCAVPSGPAGPALGAPTGLVDSAAGSVELTRAYWRYHWTVRPAQFLALDGALVSLPTRYGALNAVGTGNQWSTGPPPDGWTTPEFDDAAWCVLRAPLPILPEIDQDGNGPYPPHIIRRFCGRTRFIVDSNVGPTRLTLTVVYAGGVIAYVNGREVARGGVPPVGPTTAPADRAAFYAEPYAPEAYGPVTPEQESWGLSRDGFWTSIIWHPWRWDGKPDQDTMQKRIEHVVGLRQRRLTVEVDPALLRPGVNVLAIDNRLSPILELRTARGKGTLPPMSGSSAQRWPHVGLSSVRFAAEPADAVRSGDHRPSGVQAWAEDVHRWLLEEDFLEPGVPERRTVEIVAARGGTFSGQVVLGTDQDLLQPSAVLTDLTGPGGARIPASAVRLRWARSIPLKIVKQMNAGAFRTYMQDLFLIRYRGAPVDTWVAEWTDHRGKLRLLRSLWQADTMRLYDQLGPEAPATIGAGACQPLWITVAVPKDARPGTYESALTVSSSPSAGGFVALSARFRVRLEVIDCEVPEPRQYRAYVGVDESPWALAAWRQVPLWGPEHWVLVEEAVKAAGQLGARVISIPVIQKTELDNGPDTMIRWVKRPDGAFDYDFALADRYLDLWREYGHPEADVIVYLVLPADNGGRSGGTGTVTVIDSATKEVRVFTPPQPDTPEGERLWRDCARAVRAHLNARGVADERLHWGLFYDYIGERGFALADVLRRAVPTVGWARSSHEGRGIHGGHDVTVTWNAAVRRYQAPPFTLARMAGKPSYYFDPAAGYRVLDYQGWDDPRASLLLPRADSDVSALSLYPPLLHLRATQEMAVTTKYRGFGRICVDGWGRGSYFGPFNPYLLYPGKPGTLDGSVQFEVLREGLQETETRIALSAGGTPSPRTRSILDRRTERAWILPPRPEGQRIAEYYAGWQTMSRDLYQCGAEGVAPIGGLRAPPGPRRL
jgi:hypothetical protein